MDNNKRRFGRLQRWLWLGPLVLAASLLVLAAAGFTYEKIAEALDRERFPPPGVLVDVGGFRLHLNCTGQGSPTVVLDTGLGVPSPSWAPVQTSVARMTRVCSYDRAGYGWSDPGPQPRTSEAIATELHGLLEKAGERGPFILVGHSFGGFNVRVFARDYRPLVAGLILVDSSHEDQEARMPLAMRAEQRNLPRLLSIARVAARLGLLRLFAEPLGLERQWAPLQDTAPQVIGQLRVLAVTPKLFDAAADEFAHFSGASAAAVRASRDFGDLPLTVLTAGKAASSGGAAVSPQDEEDFHHVWVSELQTDLAGLSTRGRRILVEDSDHMIPILRPEAVIAAAEEMVRQSRDGLEHAVEDRNPPEGAR